MGSENMKKNEYEYQLQIQKFICSNKENERKVEIEKLRIINKYELDMKKNDNENEQKKLKIVENLIKLENERLHKKDIIDNQRKKDELECYLQKEKINKEHDLNSKKLSNEELKIRKNHEYKIDQLCKRNNLDNKIENNKFLIKQKEIDHKHEEKITEINNKHIRDLKKIDLESETNRLTFQNKDSERKAMSEQAKLETQKILKQMDIQHEQDLKTKELTSKKELKELDITADIIKANSEFIKQESLQNFELEKKKLENEMEKTKLEKFSQQNHIPQNFTQPYLPYTNDYNNYYLQSPAHINKIFLDKNINSQKPCQNKNSHPPQNVGNYSPLRQPGLNLNKRNPKDVSKCNPNESSTNETKNPE